MDEKLIHKYHVNISSSARSRRKLACLANVHYLRHERQFLLLATHGKHSFFEEEGERIQDVRRVGIKFAGHCIRVVQGGWQKKSTPEEVRVRDQKLRVRVTIQRERFLELKALFMEEALSWSVEELGRRFFLVPYEPYAPVRQQLGEVLRAVNKKRKNHGLPTVSKEAIPYERHIVKPFEVREIVNKELEQLSWGGGGGVKTKDENLPDGIGRTVIAAGKALGNPFKEGGPSSGEPREEVLFAAFPSVFQPQGGPEDPGPGE